MKIYNTDDGNVWTSVNWPDWSGESTSNGGLQYGIQIDDNDGNNVDMMWFSSECERDSQMPSTGL
jgi:hypothetical protein